MDHKIKIIITEENTLMRRSLIALLNEDPQLRIVGEAANDRELFNLLGTIKTDLVILDLQIPTINIWKVLEFMQQRHPAVKIIVLSMYTDLNLLAYFSKKSIHSHLSKGCNPETLFEAIHCVFNVGYYKDKTTPHQSFKNTASQRETNKEIRLNEKEKEILTYICDGKTNKEIATIFQLSPSTIDFHRTKIYNKAQCSNVAELFKYAIKTGIISVV